jgi:prevent-host-death family protein
LERTITATELAKNLSDVLSRVRYRGERFVIERNGEPVALLEPAGAQRGITLGELIAQIGDLWPPGDGFSDDLEAIQASQQPVEPPEWPC